MTTVNITSSSAVIRARSNIICEFDTAANIKVHSLVLGDKGRIAAKSCIGAELCAKDCKEVSQDIIIEQPSIWSIETPAIYSLKTEILFNGNCIDCYETFFGVRKVEFSCDHGFLLNGEKLIIKGVCLHHDAGSLGAAVPQKVWERWLRLLKEMGCNAIR